MSFPPFDSSRPSHTPPPSRSAYPQPVYGAYGQLGYGNMGYSDMPQAGQRYHPSMQNVQVLHPSMSAATPGFIPYPTQTDPYANSSFSPTAEHFAAQVSGQYAAGSDPNAMAYTARRRYQSTSSAIPMPRRPSGEASMPTMQETYEFVPSQVPMPLQYPELDAAAPTPRPGSSRSSSTGYSLATSALALEKPYECDICHTRFARHHDCRRHRETHAVNASGEKPHHCVVCGKSFTRKDALKRHSNQKGCDISTASSGHHSSMSSRSSSSPQQTAGTFYPVGSMPSNSNHY